MPTQKLGTILDQIDVTVELADGVTPQTTVGEASGRIATAAFAPDGTLLDVLGTPVALEGRAEVAVDVHGATAPDPFGGDRPLDVPSGDGPRSWVELRVDAGVEASVSAPVPAGGVVATFVADADAGFASRLLAPAARDRSLRDVLPDLAAHTALLRGLDAAALQDDHAHSLRGVLDVALGLEASLGIDWRIGVAPFAGISQELEARFEGVLRASLGLSLREEMELVVGRVSRIEPDAVRVRLRRLHEHRLSLGAALDLRITYDLGSPFLALLDEVVGSRPYERLESALDAARDAADLVEQGDWDALVEKLGDRAAEVLGDLVDTHDLRGWLESDPDAQRFFRAAARASEAWRDWVEGTRLEDLWRTLLGDAELGPGSPLRRALDEIARLDPADPDDTVERLLGADGRRAVELLETLAGVDLEALILGDGDARAAVGDARDLAARAVGFLDDTPAEIRDRLAGFADRTGVAKAVALLAEVDTPAELVEKATAAVADLVEKLLGAAVDAVGDDDLARLRGWAADLGDLIDRVDEIDDRLQAKLEALNGEAGFRIGLELERMSRRTALLDVELADELYDRVRPALVVGHVGRVLDVLFPDEPLAGGFVLRECVFTSRRVRSSAVNLLLSLVGLSAGGSRRIEESRIEIRPAAGGGFERVGRHAAAFVRFDERDNRSSGDNAFHGGIWFEVDGRADRLHPRHRYDEIDPGLRLTFEWRDTKSLPDELDGVEWLLRDLGFDPPAALGTRFTRDIPEHAPLRLAVALRFGADHLRALLANLDDEDEWEVDWLNGAARWLDERLRTDRYRQYPIRRGRAMWEVLQTDPYLDDWVEGNLPPTKSYTFPYWQDGPKDGQLTLRDGCMALAQLPITRRAVPGGLERAAELVAAATATPGAIDDAARAFAGTMRRAHPDAWASPAFGHWMLIARLTRLEPDLLTSVRGVASLRWHAGGAWREPVVSHLRRGLPWHVLGMNIFPFEG